MNHTLALPPHGLARRCAAALAAAALALPLMAAAQSDATTAQQLYQRDRAACMAGQGPQSRADCLKEARAALSEARRGRLPSADKQTLERNALARCDALPQDLRGSCLRLARGEGERTGSVHEGGVMKWLVEPADAPAAPTPLTPK